VTAGRAALVAMVVLCAFAPRSVAAVPAVAEEEAAYLIVSVETSGCTFYRNGSRYDAGRAAAHMREKYALVATGGAITTGEMFIERVATRSAFTGLAYEVECPGSVRLPLAAWLRDVLARYRANGAPRASRGAQ